jgi:hypothetical protein
MAGGSHRLILHKANFILQFFVKLSFKILFIKGQNNPYIVASYVALGATQRSGNNPKPPPLGVYGSELIPNGF